MRPLFFVLIICCGLGVLAGATAQPDWGFFGHRKINRLAVFTLDRDMMPFFRNHLEWLTEHAVDPDKRRYATKHEAVRHYIDIDHWGKSADYAYVPRRWTDALLWKGELRVVQGRDTVSWRVDTIRQASPDYPFAPASRVTLAAPGQTPVEISLGAYRSLWFNNVLPNYYEDRLPISPDSLRAYGLPLAPGATVEAVDHLSEYGILPWHLQAMHRRITQAFRDRDADRILRYCAEMGHYVGDAHVPLHTTENYNGQLTGQTGIHGFWESRIPELFAEARYDFFVGKAQYIEDPREFYWGIVLKSHSLVDSVLRTEARLRLRFPADQQLVFDERLGRTIKTQSPEFAAAWDAAMQGMVEERFRASIRAVGSVWYSCWVDAGQPDLGALLDRPGVYARSDTLSRAVGGGRIKGRVHE